MCKIVSGVIIGAVAVVCIAIYFAPPPTATKPEETSNSCPTAEPQAKIDGLGGRWNSEVRNVIVFGESGVGKSSVINMILGEEKADTSDSAVGCTFKYDQYMFRNYSLFDTVGISEGSKGKVSKTDAIQNLLQLLAVLRKGPGINLLIFVMKLGRISESLQVNYELFVRVMTEGKVPVILVITFAESEKTKNAWFETNRNYFLQYDMKFANVTSACATKGETLRDDFRCVYEVRYLESRFDVLELMDKVSLSTPWTIHENVLGTTVKSMFNTVFDYLGWLLVLWKGLTDFLIKNGFDPTNATRLANTIVT